MSISDTQLDEFIKLYKQKFDVILDRQTAYDQASKLIQLVKLTCFEKLPASGIIEKPDTNTATLQTIECNEG